MSAAVVLVLLSMAITVIAFACIVAGARADRQSDRQWAEWRKGGHDDAGDCVLSAGKGLQEKMNIYEWLGEMEKDRAGRCGGNERCGPAGPARL